MTQLDEYKIVFNVNGETAAVLVAAVNQGLTYKEAKRMLVTELYGNYCEDNHLNYVEEEAKSIIDDSSCSVVGKLTTEDPILEDLPDFAFILLHKTHKWKA